MIKIYNKKSKGIIVHNQIPFFSNYSANKFRYLFKFNEFTEVVVLLLALHTHPLPLHLPLLHFKSTFGSSLPFLLTQLLLLNLLNLLLLYLFHHFGRLL